eukprot:SAG31_NODE_35066_length_326_cov_1.193833_1_plen_50_part_01
MPSVAVTYDAGGPRWYGGIAPFQLDLKEHFIPASQQHLYMRIPFPKRKSK